MTRVVVRVLRLPLAVKLAGANALLLLAAIAACWRVYRGADVWSGLVVAALALVGGIVVNIALVRIALRPLRDLESAAQRVWSGDFNARASRSAVADPELDRVSKTFNLLLDSILAERTHIRELATEVIRVGDRERASLANALHDSIAQSIAGISYQLSAAERVTGDVTMGRRLAAVREATNGILEEVRDLSRTVYPRILDDLGLASALRELARGLSAGSGTPTVDLHVSALAEAAAKRLAAERASVLYRVAEEALQNALRHAHATHISLRLDASVSDMTLRIEDDGVGFDRAELAQRHAGTGLFAMRERVSLARGAFDVSTAPGKGTTVMTSVPITGPGTATIMRDIRPNALPHALPNENEADDSRHDSGYTRR